MSRKLLTDEEIAAVLANLPSWTRNGTALQCRLECGTFANVIALVNEIAVLAEREDHHPDLDVRYDRLVVSLTTFDRGGITGRDVDMAKQINALAMRFSPSH